FKEDELADTIINCINAPGTETFSILAARPGGTVFFANLANNYSIASLIAEGIGKDVNIFAYKGYSDGHAEFAIQLLRQHTCLRHMLKSRFESKQKLQEALSSSVESSIDLDSKVLKAIGLVYFVFESDEIKQVLQNVLRLAIYDRTVLSTGESGVSKEI